MTIIYNYNITKLCSTLLQKVSENITKYLLQYYLHSALLQKVPKKVQKGFSIKYLTSPLLKDLKGLLI